MITEEYIKKKWKEIQEALAFQNDKTEMTKLVNKQNYDKIERGNFNGLNLTDIKITLAGEIFLHEQSIRERQEKERKENL